MPRVILSRICPNMHSGAWDERFIRTMIMHDGALDITIWHGPHLCGGGTLVREGEMWQGECCEGRTRWKVSLVVGSRALEFRELV